MPKKPSTKPPTKRKPLPFPKLSKQNRIIASALAVALFIGAAAWIYNSGDDPTANPPASTLLAKLQDWNAQALLSFPFRLEPGMLLNEDSDLPVAGTEDAFKDRTKLHDVGHANLLNATYEDSVKAEASAEADILAVFGLAGSRQSFLASRVSHVRTEVTGLQTIVLTESDIADAQLIPKWADRLKTDKAVVLIQAVMLAKELKISYLDRDHKAITGELPKSKMMGKLASSSTSESQAHETYTDVVLGYKSTIAIDPVATPDLAAEVAKDMKEKGYRVEATPRIVLISATKAEVPPIMKLTKATVAQKAAITRPMPTPERDAAIKFRTDALKGVPVRRAPDRAALTPR